MRFDVRQAVFDALTIRPAYTDLTAEHRVEGRDEVGVLTTSVYGT